MMGRGSGKTDSVFSWVFVQLLSGPQLVVETVDVLPYGEYAAIYPTPGSPLGQEAAGTYQVFRYGAGKSFRWLSYGIFTRNKERRW